MDLNSVLQQRLLEHAQLRAWQITHLTLLLLQQYSSMQTHINVPLLLRPSPNGANPLIFHL